LPQGHSQFPRVPADQEHQPMKSMEELFHTGLQDVYYAEKQLIRTLKKMSKKANDSQLQKAFAQHAEQTQGQVERLDKVFEMIDKKPRGKKCDAILGIIAEGDEILEEAEDDNVLDAGLLAAAQAAEHYEIARYGTLVAWAREIGNPQAARLLQQTLEEEKKTDVLLTKIAEARVNKAARQSA
jgi:ferritin-like metal-binding protein YciE